MYRIGLIGLLIILPLTSCQREVKFGEYVANEEGHLYSNGVYTKYKIDENGFVYDYQIDIVYTYLEALEINEVNYELLTEYEFFSSKVSSVVSPDELKKCGYEEIIPMFISVNDSDYYFNIESCSFDSYIFVSSSNDGQPLDTPIYPLNSRLYTTPNFLANPYTENVAINMVYYSEQSGVWIKEEFCKLPISIKQQGVLGETNEDDQDDVYKLRLLEEYFILNQSYEKLIITDGGWSDYTIGYYGLDNEILRYVDINLVERVLRNETAFRRRLVE